MARLLLAFAAAAGASGGVSAVPENPTDVVSMLQVGSSVTSKTAQSFTVTSLESYGPLALSQLRRRSPVPATNPGTKEAGDSALASMRAEPERPLVQLVGCSALTDAMTTGSWLSGYVNQEYFVVEGAHEVALAAMKKFPDNLPLQMSCARALNNMVHLNSPMATIVGNAGAIEAFVRLMRRFPNEPQAMGDLFGIFGSFCDYSMENRERVAALGGIDLAFNITKKHYNEKTVLGLQCMASTQCWPMENHKQLKRNGYISDTPQHMRDFPNALGIRGEGIFVLSMCFLGEPDSDQLMVQNGLIEEIVKALQDAPHMQLDVLSTTDRIYAHGLDLLSAFANERVEWRERAVEAGAVEQVAAAMVNFAQSTAKANVAMQKFNLDHLDVVGKGCKTLGSLAMDSSKGRERFYAVRDQLKSGLFSNNTKLTMPAKCREAISG
mmetsp:Transcript_24828/g.57683  ORF Transcript_24828/g.57683 Transcript_24828/m.57683 type:complete len:438 (-) Transcript_24828:97-1410(-)|eukprot:CAMPEP_0171077684 /NCGR_PEP_ID=MMETSP0766_2-20121228/14179_1 /TAXON_ID=439317 /ORGANISM="Gambierdiscus australes, Strain CAWD 149" /LENGTH=437 /DNA_ID=CAMNT_0011534759 /DNA_START=50 /DNA_END=1363 /DNA_ORIENTATION=+